MVLGAGGGGGSGRPAFPPAQAQCEQDRGEAGGERGAAGEERGAEAEEGEDRWGGELGGEGGGEGEVQGGGGEEPALYVEGGLLAGVGEVLVRQV